MKKWALRIALSLRMLAAPAVAQFVGPSVQGDPPSHDRVEAPWLIDGPINGQTFRQIHQRGLHRRRPREPSRTRHHGLIFDHRQEQHRSLSLFRASTGLLLCPGISVAHSSSRLTSGVLLVNSPIRGSLPLTWNGTQREPQRRAGQKNSLLRSSSTWRRWNKPAWWH